MLRREDLFQAGRYESLPGDVMRRTDLSATAKLVYAAMAGHLFNGDVWVWPSVRRLGELTGSGRTAVRDALAQLEAAGLLAVRRKRGAVARYAFLRPPSTEPESGPVTPGGLPTGEPESGPVVTASEPESGWVVGRNPARSEPESGHEVPKETLQGNSNSNSERGDSEFSTTTATTTATAASPDSLAAIPAPRSVNHVAFAEALLKRLKVGRGNRVQLAADRTTLQRVARHIAAGLAGADLAEAVTWAYTAAGRIAADPGRLNKAGAFMDEFKRRLRAHGNEWKGANV